MKKLLVASYLRDIIGKVDQELGEAALGCSVIAEDRGERGIAKGLGEALTESFTSAGVVAQASGKLANLIE